MTKKNNLPRGGETIEVAVSPQSLLWPDISDILENAVRKALGAASLTTAPVEVSLVLADNAFVQNLNREYRGQDKPTNVLSFPQDDPHILGDIIMAYETVRDEAAAQDKSFEHHAAHLAVHGALHLVGYDHENEEEAEDMEQLEVRILEEMGIKNPYKS